MQILHLQTSSRKNLLFCILVWLHFYLYLFIYLFKLHVVFLEVLLDIGTVISELVPVALALVPTQLSLLQAVLSVPGALCDLLFDSCGKPLSCSFLHCPYSK